MENLVSVASKRSMEVKGWVPFEEDPRAAASQPSSSPSTIPLSACSPGYPWGEKSDDGGEEVSWDRGGGPAQAKRGFGAVVQGCWWFAVRGWCLGRMDTPWSRLGWKEDAGQAEGNWEGSMIMGWRVWEGIATTFSLPGASVAEPCVLREQCWVLPLTCKRNWETTALLQWKEEKLGARGEPAPHQVFIQLCRERKVKCKS